MFEKQIFLPRLSSKLNPQIQNRRNCSTHSPGGQGGKILEDQNHKQRHSLAIKKGTDSKRRHLPMAAGLKSVTKVEIVITIPYFHNLVW